MRTRLEQFLKAENLSPSRFADQIGIQRSGISHILSGRNKPGFVFIEKMLLAYPSLNAEWLITGKGKMYRELKTASLFHSDEDPVISSRTGQVLSPAQKTEQLPAPESPEDRQYENTSKPSNVNNYNLSPKEKTELIKVLLFYSDNTFSEYFPGDSRA